MDEQQLPRSECADAQSNLEFCILQAIFLNVRQCAGVMADCIDLFNVIVFIRASDHVITILCHVTKNSGWKKHFRFHRYLLIQAKFYLDNKFLLVNI